jgi:hypothetical protein
VADANERMSILTQIARGDTRVRRDKFFYDSKEGLVVSQEVEELPDCNERVKAIAELNKMCGDYAPIKNDHTSKGEAIKQVYLLPDGTKIDF